MNNFGSKFSGIERAEIVSEIVTRDYYQQPRQRGKMEFCFTALGLLSALALSTVQDPGNPAIIIRVVAVNNTDASAVVGTIA